jgi:hypothetical protein
MIATRDPTRAMIATRDPTRAMIATRDPTRAMIATRDPTRAMGPGLAMGLVLLDSRQPVRDRGA